MEQSSVFGLRFLVFVILSCGGLDATLLGSTFEQYQLVEQFHFPVIDTRENQGPVVFDNLSDGRLLGISTRITDANARVGVPEVYLETATGSRQFERLGPLPLPAGGTWNSDGASFVRISAGQSGPPRIAVGNNRTEAPLVGVFAESDLLAGELPDLLIDWFELNHFGGAWFDDRQLVISGGSFTQGHVDLLDTGSSPSSPRVTRIVDGIEGASAGVGIDSVGNVYTANGFANDTPGASETGDIKQFDFSAWQDVVNGASPLNFENQGTLIANVLSGGSLVFDTEDNLLVGGGDFFGGGPADFFAILPNPDRGLAARQLDPDSEATSFYVVSYNEVTQEIYANEPFARDFPSNIDNTRVYVYRVPEPGGAALCVLGMAVLVWRRKWGVRSVAID